MTLLFLALALSMDAFAAAISQGAKAKPAPTTIQALKIGATFGMAQAAMPLVGWALGLAFSPIISHVDHWIAFALLSFIGASMIREGRASESNTRAKATPLASGRTLIALALATSVDAAAAGVTLSMLDQPVFLACLLIGVITLAVSTTGVMIGKAAGLLVGRRAEIFGGIVLIALGSKILIEHTLLGA